MLPMVEKRIRRGMCYAARQYAKVNNKNMKNYDKNKQTQVMYCDMNNLYGWPMLQILPVDGFNQRNDKSNFNEKL